MKTLHAVVVLLAVLLTACHKLPYSEFFHTLTLPVVDRRPPANVSGKLEPVAVTPPAPAIDRSGQVIVLGYHRFVDKVQRPDTEITPAEFEAQMQALKDQGVAVISMEDFLAWRRKERNVPAHSALITIDDGYNVAYTIAWPILKKFGYPFTLFIYTDYVRGRPKSGGGSLTWEQLAEMRDAGVSIQSHTVSHADLRRKKSGPPGATYEDWLWNELHGSKAMIENHLGIQVTALALPFGLANDQVREMAAKAGYEMVFTVNGEKIGFATPMAALGRYMVQSDKPKLFTTATTFDGGGIAGSGTATIALSDLHPLPADEATIHESSPLIRASLASLGAIEPGSLSMRISSLGEVAVRFDPQNKTATYHAHALPPDKYTVILAAKSQGKKIESRWSFTVAPGAGAPSAIAAGPSR